MQNNYDIIQDYSRSDFYKDINELIKLFEKFHGLDKTEVCKNKKAINVKCPICSKEKKTIVSDSLFKKNEEVVTLQYLIGTICEHSFYIVIDKNLNIRDYQLEFNNNISKMDQTTKENKIDKMEFNSNNNVKNFSRTGSNKNLIRRKMSKEEIYQEFKDLINENNPEFREFAVQEKNDKLS